MTENECVETLQYLLGYENAVDKGELDLQNYLNSQEKEALKFILEEIQLYRAIGTVEEFNALKEKATPKKLEIEKFWGYDDLMCPNCKSYKIRNPKYCCDCGQKLDWQ